MPGHMVNSFFVIFCLSKSEENATGTEATGTVSVTEVVTLRLRWKRYCDKF